MTKKKKKSSYSQPTLFDYVKGISEYRQLAVPKGSLDIETEFKVALADDLRHAVDEYGRELSRFQVAARMSEFLGREITKTMLDNWTTDSHPHTIRVTYLPAFVWATGGQRRHAEVVARHSGFVLLPGEEAVRARIRRLDEEGKRVKAEKQQWRTYLKQIEGGTERP